MDHAAERRTVTILFSDLSGFTRLSESMDPEEVSELVDAMFRKFRAVIEAQGGTVDKFIGDAVMAVFGAPVAHADDALRAVRAGLAMQAELASFSRERSLELAMRVGINTGEVVWGSVGGGAATAMGDAVNVAQRLESAARPGAVFLSRATEALVRRNVRCTGCGTIQVRGRQEPVEALEAVEEMSGSTEVHPAAPTPFVGRDRELAKLAEAVAGGRPAFVYLEGEAGCGKSRLLAELRRAVRTAGGGAWVTLGRVLEGVRLPLAPFGDIVRTEAGVSGLDRRDAERIVAALRADLERPRAGAAAPAPLEAENQAHLVALSLGHAVPEARVRDIDPVRLTTETHHAWCRWIASRCPALVCLEDLHWADAATMALVETLPVRLRDLPVVVVASGRPGRDAPAGFERLTLGEIPEDAEPRLSEALLGGPVSPELARFLREKTGGNPYYLEEFARYLLEEHALAGPPFTLRTPPDRFPAGLQGLLVARLDSLPHPAKEALKVASVVGRTFWQGFLSELAGQDVSEGIAAARARGMVFPQGASLLPGDSQLVFKHALLRDAAYSLLTKRDRSQLHVRSAERLEARIPDGGRRVKALAASHRRLAGQNAEAATLWLEAAGEALSDSPAEALAWAKEAHASRADGATALMAGQASHATADYPAAARHALEALEFAAEKSERRASACLLLAQSRLHTGPVPEALEWADRAENAHASPPIALEALQIRSGALLNMGSFSESLAAAEAGLQKLVDARDGIRDTEADRLRRGLLEAAALAHSRMGAYDLALAAVQKGLVVARRGRPAGVASALNIAANVHQARGDYPAALAHYKEALELWSSTGDRHSMATARANLANLQRYLGDFDGALAGLRESLEFFREAGDRRAVVAVLTNLGGVQIARGRYAEALEAHRESLAICREMGVEAGVAASLNNLGVALDSMGDFAGAIAAYGESLEIRRRLGDRPGIARCLNNLGVLSRIQGRLDAAEGAHREALAINREIDNLDGMASATVNLGAVEFARARFEPALRLQEEALALFRRMGSSEGIAECLVESGRSLGSFGRYGEAAARLGEALELARRIGDRLQSGRALAATGTLMHMRGDMAGARTALEEALAIQRSTGDPAGVADTLNRLGTLRYAFAEFDPAMASYKEALRIFRELGAPSGIATSLDFMGLALHSAGRSLEALAACEEGLAIRRRIGDASGLATSLLNRACILDTEEARDSSMASAQECVALRRSIGDPRSLGIALYAVGELNRARGSTAVALASIREAREIFQNLGDPPGLLACVGSLASCLTDSRDWVEAQRAFEEAIALARRLDNRLTLARSLLNFARMHSARGAPADGLASVEESLRIFSEIRFPRGAASALYTRGEIRALLADGAAAQRDFREAEAAFAAIGASDEVREVQKALRTLRGEA